MRIATPLLVFVVILFPQISRANDVTFEIVPPTSAADSQVEAALGFPTIELAERRWATPGIEQQSPQDGGMRMSDIGMLPRKYSFGRLPDWLDGAVWPLTKARIEASMRAGHYEHNGIFVYVGDNNSNR